MALIVDRNTWLAYLDQDARAVRQLEARIRSNVQNARAQGASWADIGRALGVTRQAAQMRYGRDTLEGLSSS